MDAIIYLGSNFLESIILVLLMVISISVGVLFLTNILKWLRINQKQDHDNKERTFKQAYNLLVGSMVGDLIILFLLGVISVSISYKYYWDPIFVAQAIEIASATMEVIAFDIIFSAIFYMRILREKLKGTMGTFG